MLQPEFEKVSLAERTGMSRLDFIYVVLKFVQWSYHKL
jgi:hypothetical protein